MLSPEIRRKTSLIVTILAGLALRFLFLGRTSLWFDEVASFYVQYGLSAKEIAAKLSHTLYMFPLYNFFMNFWKFLGKTEFMLRLPSVIFGTATIFVIYALGKRLFKGKTGLLSAYVLAISPFHIYYSQEVRMYSLLSLLCAVSVYFFVRFLETGGKRFIACSAAGFVLSAYTHFMALLAVLSCQLFFLFFYRRDKRLFKSWKPAALLTLTLLVPCLLCILLKLSAAFSVSSSGWVPDNLPRITPAQLLFTLQNFSLGYNIRGWVSFTACAVFLLLFLKGLKGGGRGVMLCLYIVVIPIAVMFVLSSWRAFYADRYIIFSSLFFYLLAAKGLESLKRPFKIAVLILLTLFSSAALFNYYRDYLPGDFNEHLGLQSKKDHRGASEFIMRNFEAGDAVFHTNFNTTFPFEYYFKIKAKDSRFSEVDNSMHLRVNEAQDKLIPSGFAIEHGDIDLSEKINWNSYKRIWLVYSTWILPNILYPEKFEKRDKYKECEDIDKVVQYLDKRYQRALEKRFKGIKIILYRKL